MISFEIAVTNFQSINYQDDPIRQICLKFGQISTTIQLNGGQGGKCLFLDLSAEQLQRIYHEFVCGLFILNRQGKFFSLLNLQKLKIEDKIICNQITFLNDFREAKYIAQFSMAVKGFKQPKIANIQKLEARQNGLDLLKKPPVPKNAPATVKIPKNTNKQQINSFLYGNKPVSHVQTNSANYLMVLKEEVRKQNEIKSNLQKTKNNFNRLPKETLARTSYNHNPMQNSDLFDLNPPMMEFTNDEQQQPIPQLSVPKVNYIQYEQSMPKSQVSKRTKLQTPKQNNFQTFNRNGYSRKSGKSPQTPTQFELNRQQQTGGTTVKRGFSKQALKNMAKQQVQNVLVKENVLIPIARGDKFELVPLSALKPEQIIEYVQRQRKTEEQARQNEIKKRRLEELQMQIQNKNRKIMQMNQKIQSNKQLNVEKKQSKQIRSSIKNQIYQQSNDDESQKQSEKEQDYMSDFQSMSVSNSAIKSRISSRGNPKNISKQEQSVQEDDYSQEFQSYSHSMLSKTNKKQSQSVSDYSESYRSISQSFRK